MMNHHLPAVPHGQPPMPPPAPLPGPRRQQDLPYATAQPSMRSPPAFMAYHHPHISGHPPPAYPPQQYPPPHWYPAYPQMQLPPRPYQPPYGPFVVSSYPPSQPVMAPVPAPPPSLPLQPRTSTPFQPAMSPSVGVAPVQANVREQSPATVPVHAPTNPVVTSPSGPSTAKPVKTVNKEPFRPPVSRTCFSRCLEIALLTNNSAALAFCS